MHGTYFLNSTMRIYYGIYRDLRAYYCYGHRTCTCATRSTCLWHDESVTKPRRNRDETTRVLSTNRRNHHFSKIKIYYIYIILYRIWWFRRLIDKNRVVSSRFRRGFVVEVRMAKPSIHLRSMVNGAVNNQRRSIDARTISGQQHTVHSTQYTAQSTQYLLHGTESTVHSLQYTVHST